jgi:hypothetical protein
MFEVHFDVFLRSMDELSECILVMFDHFNLLEDFGIPINHLLCFVRALQKHYYDNPYHNFQHAFDVAQMCLLFLTKSELREYLTKNDILALLTAALCHDLCHPALNNTYQVNAQTELALIYNDNSVLENYHASQAFKLLKEPRNNILVGLNQAENKEMRKSIISAILATDMTVMFQLFSHILLQKCSQKSRKKNFEIDKFIDAFRTNFEIHNAYGRKNSRGHQKSFQSRHEGATAPHQRDSPCRGHFEYGEASGIITQME